MKQSKVEQIELSGEGNCGVIRLEDLDRWKAAGTPLIVYAFRRVRRSTSTEDAKQF